LKEKLPDLEASLNDPDVFKSVYRFAFDFAKNRGQRCLSLDSASEMLAMLLGGKWPELYPFIQFLKASTRSRFAVHVLLSLCNFHSITLSGLKT
jgi:DCN1-like protein 4/5